MQLRAKVSMLQFAKAKAKNFARKAFGIVGLCVLTTATHVSSTLPRRLMERVSNHQNLETLNIIAQQMVLQARIAQRVEWMTQ
jgi:hypothetical protein